MAFRSVGYRSDQSSLLQNAEIGVCRVEFGLWLCTSESDEKLKDLPEKWLTELQDFFVSYHDPEGKIQAFGL